MLRKAIEEDWSEPIGNTTIIDTINSQQAQFVSHFYAAWAGSTATPTALPSRNDIESGNLYVARLQEITSDPMKMIELAHDFGVFVKDAEASNPKALRSFVVAVRTHGDKFYLTLLERRKKERRQAINEARKSHEHLFKDAYSNYLRTRETEIQVEFAEYHKEFIQENDAARRRITDGPFALHGHIKERVLTSFDTEEGRLERLREFCIKRSIPVLNFWEWDKNINPNTFNTGNY